MFIYFVPGVRARARELTSLAYAFEGGVVGKTADCSDGPSGQPGTLLADASVPAQFVQWVPAEQVWKDCGDYWLGYWKDQLPTPNQLARQTILDGYPVTLADGNDWVIPRGLYYDDSGAHNALPRLLDVDREGKWILGNVRNDLAKLWDVTKRFYPAWMEIVRRAAQTSPENETLTFELALPDEADMVEVCLQANYRVSRFEIAALGLVDRYLPKKVLLALIDWETYCDHLKKKTQPD